MQLSLFFDLISDLLKHFLPGQGRIRHEMLQRLYIAILYAVRNPSKVPISFHRYLPLQIPQRMSADIARFGLESTLITLPMRLQVRPKILNLYNRYSPS
jgi:hypothetical protein